MAQTTVKSAPVNLLVSGVAGTTAWTGGNVTYAYATTLDHSNYAVTNDPDGALIAGTNNFFDGDADDVELKADIELAILHLSNVSGLTFSLTTDFEASDLKMLARDNLTSGGWGLNGRGDFPGTDVHEDAGTGFEAYTYFDTAFSSMTTTPELGGSSNRLHTVMHEIMHSTGFGHPHDTGSGSTVFGDSGMFGDNVLDNDRYTVMSYERGGIDQNSQSRDYGYAVTPMALDIAALQHLYGSRANHVADTVYQLTDPATAARDLDASDNLISIGRAFYCIWDTGGTDTISYAGDNHVLINLNAATLDQDADSAAILGITQDLSATDLFNQLLPDATAGELRDDLTDPEWHAGGFFSRVFFDDGTAVLGGFSIANSINAEDQHQNSGIEQAEGGKDDDILIGDGADNRISGNRGDDLMHGSDGNDTILGGGGNDVVFGGSGENRLYGADGDDTITGGADDERAWGGDGADTLLGGGGNDVLKGGDGNDAISGQDGDDTTLGDAGDDTLLGGSGWDDLGGGSGNDTLDGGDDSDILSGGRGDDNLEGGEGHDWLFGGTGNDTLSDSTGRNKFFGEGGDDLMWGGDHNDAMWGGNGNDTLQGGKGNDRLRGDAGNDLLLGLGGYDYLFGKIGDDYLSGGGGRDNLNGGLGKDILFGDGGADRIIASHGKDKLSGGIGSDTFVFDTSNKVRDIITDFTKGDDKLDLSQFNFKSKAAALAHAFEIGTGNDLMMGFASNGTRIKIKGLDLADLDGGDLLI